MTVGVYNTPGYAQAVAVSGVYAYVADGNGGLRIINISNPGSPTLAGFCAWLTCSVAGVAVRGNYAYLADDNRGLYIVDISNPASPTLAGSWPYIEMGAFRVVVSGVYAYIASYMNGLWIFNISNPSNPFLIANNPCDPVLGVAVSGNYAYLAENDGLRIMDISMPQLPRPVSFYNTPGEPTGVVVTGAYAYVTDGSSGLRVLNISNPASPTLAGFYNTQGYTLAVAVSGCRGYVADYTHFGIYDISYFQPCPAPPQRVDSLVVQYQADADRVLLNWAAVTADTNGNAVDVSRYVVYRADGVNAVVWDSVGVPVPADTTVFFDSTNAGRRFYYVKAVVD